MYRAILLYDVIHIEKRTNLLESADLCATTLLDCSFLFVYMYALRTHGNCEGTKTRTHIYRHSYYTS